MDLPELKPIVEVAIDTVVSVVNRAKERLGERQTLKDLAHCRELIAGKVKLNLTSLRPPLAVTAEAFIDDTIRYHWKLTNTFLFTINYKGTSFDETSQYYYYEAIFSQPTKTYPIPQATASVYFRVQDKYTDPPTNNAPVPTVECRVEGSRQVHDVRFVTVVPEWLLALIKMKITLFQRIEKYDVF